MPLFTNSYLTTARSKRNSITGISAPAADYMPALAAFFGPFKAQNWGTLPENVVLSSEYEAHVDAGTDIQVGDYLTSVLQADQQTPWPDISAADTLHVIFTQEIPLPVLPQRYVFIQRVRVGGLPQ